MPIPPIQLLAELYRQLPFLVVHLSTDGIILYCNPESLRLTGYEESELLGKNFWATLFPGRLFAQVPRFISAIGPSPLLKDTPLTISTLQGELRVVAFTRFIHASQAGDTTDSGTRTVVLVGVDLTDRLLDSDKQSSGESEPSAGHIPFGPNIGNGGAIEGEIITPLAISPPAPRCEAGAAGRSDALRQVHERLMEIEIRMAALQQDTSGQTHSALNALDALLRSPAGACGIPPLLARAQDLQHALTQGQIEPLCGLIREIISLSPQHQQ